MTDIIITRIKGGNAAAFGASMVNQLLKQSLDLSAREATSVLEECTESRSTQAFPASNVLSVLVPSIVVKALRVPEEVGQFESDIGAVAAAVAVNALGRDAKGQSSH